ncbi:MAG: META domain-containing protein [Kofleriaceae bacterium]|nr:META domain-containing protein [Kofleriaceae bacterium]
MKPLRVVTAIFLGASACSSTAPKNGAGSREPIGSAGAGSAPAPTATALAGKWQVTGISDDKGVLHAVVGDNKPTLSFDKDKVFGNAGCNQFSGTVTQTDTTVTWAAIRITEMACADRAAMEQEGAYMRALQTSATFTIVDGELRFRNSAGTVTLTLTLIHAP